LVFIKYFINIIPLNEIIVPISVIFLTVFINIDCVSIRAIILLMNYTYIQTDERLKSFLSTFEEKQFYLLAVDIEAENNRHAYGETLCLIQIFDGTNRTIIDPLKINSDLVKVFFENRDTLKVMYDAGSDLSLLKNACNIEVKSVLDLRPAVELLEYEKQDLHSIIGMELGLILENKNKFQKQDWTIRPISREAIEYALDDVEHLIDLKEAMFKKLYERHFLDIFWLKNLKVQNKDYTRDPLDKYYKISGYDNLSETDRARFRKIFDIREDYAKRFNIPPSWVITKTDLISLTRDINCIQAIRVPMKFRASLIQDMLALGSKK
jgi:ribonuclease D